MNLQHLSKPELLKLKENVEAQLNTIEYLNKKEKIEIKESFSRDKLSDLINKKSTIFCVRFVGSVIHNMDYVKITFFKKEDNENYIGFSTQHDSQYK